MSEELKALDQSIKKKKLNLKEWRNSRRHELVLPSGLTVIVRDVDMTDILMTGTLPPSVISLAKEAAGEDDDVDLEEIGVKMLEESTGEFNALLNAITKAALIEPAIGDVSDETHITLDELPFGDKNYLMEWVNRGEAPVSSFRPGEAESVASV